MLYVDALKRVVIFRKISKIRAIHSGMEFHSGMCVCVLAIKSSYTGLLLSKVSLHSPDVGSPYSKLFCPSTHAFQNGIPFRNGIEVPPNERNAWRRGNQAKSNPSPVCGFACLLYIFAFRPTCLAAVLIQSVNVDALREKIRAIAHAMAAAMGVETNRGRHR